MTPRKALSVVIAGLVAGLAPDPIVAPSAWSAQNIVLVDGPYAGQKWDPGHTPYLVEILDRMAPEDPCTRVAVRKPSQVGFSQTAINWLGYIADVAPASTMVIFPTVNTVYEFNRDKFDPTLSESPALRRKVVEARGRSGRASTASHKKIRGGQITLTGANSSADLRSKTVKNTFRDEVDDWPKDLNDQGSPMKMADARQRSYVATGDHKTLLGSTPTIKNESIIDAEFEAGDQRYFMVPCPHCDHRQRLVFGGKDVPHGLKFNKIYPHNAYYVCEDCGSVIEHHEKEAMVAKGQWVATHPGPGRQPSYHIDILCSPFVTWDWIAEEFLKSKDDPVDLKTFTNLTLGESWEEKGDSPDWNRLFALRSDYPARMVPEGGVILTAGVDVQQDGLYYEVVAWGPNYTSWSIDVGYLEGETAGTEGKVWKDLDEILYRPYPTALGGQLVIDLMGIDSGYNTDAVYAYKKTRPNVLALKGVDGWGRAAISTAQAQEGTASGKRSRRGVKAWLVGTWSLKSRLFGNLKKPGLREGKTEDPHGYCHFSTNVHDERYFQQLTSEYYKSSNDPHKSGRWVAPGANHYLDCRIYAMAVAERPSLNVRFRSLESWQQKAVERGVHPAQGDLENLWHPAAERPKTTPRQAPASADDATPARRAVKRVAQRRPAPPRRQG